MINELFRWMNSERKEICKKTPANLSPEALAKGDAGIFYNFLKNYLRRPNFLIKSSYSATL